ncbi:LysR family transcriptional regulator [Canibacter zhoujuaniae]|uniref:LysR family transcriptional regulator n=1 Tax=Canibacter zhoujuaniae TaxID=2708343 RepID=UPI001420C13F|nr:LysR family transcriptional regulator [Canibacter zhoujuaniae]
MLDVKRLRLLWELDRRGTVIAVADALHQSSSAVSQQLALLEREVGVTLLRRSGRVLELTPAAQVLVAETENVLRAVEQAADAVQQKQPQVTGKLRVAAFQTAMLALLPQAIQRIRRNHPGVHIELIQYEPELALRETWLRNFDLVIAEQYPEHATEQFAGLESKPLTRDKIQLALPRTPDSSPEFQSVKTLSDTQHLPWVMEPKGTATRHFAEQACRLAGFEPDVRFETADLQAHVRLVATGNAVALLPSLVHFGSPYSKANDIKLLDLPGSPRRTIFTAARKSSRKNAALKAFRQVLETEAAALQTETI